MDAMPLTATITLLFIAGLIAYDVYAYRTFGVDGTITGLVRWCNAKWPLFGVLLGMVIGGLLVHWFGL